MHERDCTGFSLFILVILIKKPVQAGYRRETLTLYIFIFFFFFLSVHHLKPFFIPFYHFRTCVLIYCGTFVCVERAEGWILMKWIFERVLFLHRWVLTPVCCIIMAMVDLPMEQAWESVRQEWLKNCLHHMASFSALRDRPVSSSTVLSTMATCRSLRLEVWVEWGGRKQQELGLSSLTKKCIY